ncbi:hypothetical protein ACNI65_13915 [Roseateles sp. So40a]|uniref:hypothetical protein n=1 Tax=Roseateles sp. So40a TaxID=3400226 RepID=UPI003A8B757E
MKALCGLLLSLPLLAVGQTGVTAHTDGKTVWIEDGGLGPKEVEKVHELFATHWHYEAIVVRNIMGGVDLAEQMLYTKFANKPVTVSSRCLSACALLALAGDPVILNRDAVLAIHGTYSRVDGSLNAERSLKGLDWLAGRLPTVPKETLRTALTFPRKDDQGLLIRPANDGSGLIAVDLCQRLPDQCKRVRYIGPGESRMTLAEPTAMSSAPTTARAVP